MKPIDKQVRRHHRGVIWLTSAVLSLMGFWRMTRMPGESFQGELPEATPQQEWLAEEVARHVHRLAGEIGERNATRPEKLQAAARYIEEQWRRYGYQTQRHSYRVRDRSFDNLMAERPGVRNGGEIVVIGAHYDSVIGSPGANDNATGVAAMLALARLGAGRPSERTVRWVAFVNEEPPFFWTKDMGSLVYAKECRARGENITAMLSLETIGYYSDRKGSQRYPFPVGFFYPNTGNFVGFVGNLSSRALVRRVVGLFRRHAPFPCEGATLPGLITGVGWSDHWSFWKQGYPALMVTDTAPFRYPYYHTAHDTPDKIDYLRLARVVEGLATVIHDLSGGPVETLAR